MNSFFINFLVLLINTSIYSLPVFFIVILSCTFKYILSVRFKKLSLLTAIVCFVLIMFLATNLKYIDISNMMSGFQALGNINTSHTQTGTTALVSQNSILSCSFQPFSDPATLNYQIIKIFESFYRWQRYIFILWMFGFLFTLTRLCIGVYAIFKIEKTSDLAISTESISMMDDLKRKTGIRQNVKLFFNAANISPITFGFFHPCIVLPLEAQSWSPERLRIVLLHEMLHIKTKDNMINIFIKFLCAFFWFNPLIWVIARLLRTSQETVCDAGVIDSGVKSHIYAKELVDIAGELKVSKLKLHLNTPMFANSYLEERIRHILSDKKLFGTYKRRYITAGAIAILVMSIFLLLSGFAVAINNQDISYQKTDAQKYASGRDSVSQPVTVQPEDIPDLWPVKTGMEKTQIFQTNPLNKGIDIKIDADCITVVASANGKVLDVGTNEKYGGFISIQHENKLNSIYGILCEKVVHIGDVVQKGDVIGYSYTGKVYFELRSQNKVIEPLSVLKTNEWIKTEYN